MSHTFLDTEADTLDHPNSTYAIERQQLKNEIALRMAEDAERLALLESRAQSIPLSEDVVREGGVAPDFAATSIEGQSLRLSRLLRSGPVVLNFYRGGWCPFCNLELRELQEVLPQIKAFGGSLIAISPEVPERAAQVAARLDERFTIVSDQDNALSRLFGLTFTVDPELLPLYDRLGIDLEAANGNRDFEIPIPATYVIGRDSRVAKAFIERDYTQRMEVRDILMALKSLRKL
ncbi:MAG: peroxiredoxin-like family protein, partial [Verrucomicrobiota bacterium]